MKYANLVKSSLFALTLSSATVMAATQGTLGPNSTGTLNIELDIDPLVMVSNLGNIDLGNYSGAGNLTGSDSFCIYRNSTGPYGITMTGSGAGNAFLLSDGSNNLAYTVSFTNASANPMTAGSLLTAQTGANTTSTDCSAGTANNVSVGITVDNAALSSAPAGTYLGVLTILVAVE
jgi:hypothetical protein